MTKLSHMYILTEIKLTFVEDDSDESDSLEDDDDEEWD